MTTKEKIFKILEKVKTPGFKPEYKTELLAKTNQEFMSYIHNEPKGSGLYYSFLNEYVKEIKPKTIVELGNREGAGLISLYSGLTDRNQSIYSIDIVNDLRFITDEIRMDGRVHLLFGDVCSKEILEQIPNKIDLLFCDTVHTAIQLKNEWNSYQDKLSDNAVVFIDDINLSDKINTFNEIKDQVKITSDDLHVSGFGIIIFERK